MFKLIHLRIFMLHFLGVSCDFTENLATNQSILQASLERKDEGFTIHEPGDKWTTEAIKDIAYYLRNHKFNDWDNRNYKGKPNENFIGFYAAFTIPQLRSLHWEVKLNCHNDFYKCIGYLYSKVNTAPYSRTENLIFTENHHNEALVNTLYYECKERYAYANKIGLPFDSPAEKFQWGVTASYYMCWFTMSGIPALSMIGESCDNFANCWNTYFRNHNHDPRADDNMSFKCAMYSFCPDPCCPVKHFESIDACFNDKRNPCFVDNSEGNSQTACYMDRKHNQSFKDMINNKWNISCNCREGYKWISKFGMCVDINECILGTHKCDIISQDCLNVPGRYICLCKWEFYLNDNATLCLKRNTTLLS